jgi:hypothetical protein
VISGGVYVVRVLDRPGALGDDLLPPKLLSLSSCLTESFPDAWALDWFACSEEERSLAAAKVGIPAAALPSVLRRMTELFDPGPLGWPNVWSSVDAARGAVSEFQLDEQNFALLELGVPEDFASVLLQHIRPKPGEGLTGLGRALASQRRAPFDETALGWEPLGIELGGTFHSWLCNGLHSDAYKRLSLRPGTFGLLSSEQEARAVVDLIESGLGAEPVPWFPGALVQHPWETVVAMD